MKNQQRKLGNKGFSLVELIIVIAIMAILAGALAPQLIKYLDKSRKSTDVQSGQTIATAVNAALANEAAYNDAADTTVAACFAAGTLTEFQKEIKGILGSQPAPKYKPTDNTDFFIDVDTDKSFKVYAGSAVDSAKLLYPTVAPDYK